MAAYADGSKDTKLGLVGSRAFRPDVADQEAASRIGSVALVVGVAATAEGGGSITTAVTAADVAANTSEKIVRRVTSRGLPRSFDDSFVNRRVVVCEGIDSEVLCNVEIVVVKASKRWNSRANSVTTPSAPSVGPWWNSLLHVRRCM